MRLDSILSYKDTKSKRAREMWHLLYKEDGIKSSEVLEPQKRAVSIVKSHLQIQNDVHG